MSLYNKLGLSIGIWNMILGSILVLVSWIIDKDYIKLGTILNIFIIGFLIDFFLWLDLSFKATHSWKDILMITLGITIMGIGGGINNAAKLGSGPKDGFMLSISDKTGKSISKVRIISESIVLLLGLLLGGPVFIFTFIFTLIQSPIFQFSYLACRKFIIRAEENQIPKT